MIWYVLIPIAVLLAVITATFPVIRRLWAVAFITGKFAALWLADVVGLRWLGHKLTNRPYVKLGRPELARRWCEDMGPTFIKFGQIVASSAGMFPDAYVAEFQRVLDRVKPFSFDDVQRTLVRELGAETAQQLVEIEPTQLASASIAQVHTAALRDGTQVVIKVQRPGIDKRCAADMKIMRTLAHWVARWKKDVELANPVGVVDDFTQTLMEELDFRREADNLERFNSIMAEFGHKHIRAPVPHRAYTTQKVLVMERFTGLRVDRFDEIKARGINGEQVIVDGLRSWVQCVVFHGFFHGDVHAGNLMILENHDLGFLDFGIVGRFGDRDRFLITDYMVAFASGNYRRLAEIICEMAGTPPGLNMDGFVADLAESYKPLLTTSFGKINYSELLPNIQRVATKHRVKMPNAFILITKQFLYFDRYAKALAPSLNVFSDPRLILGMMGDIQKARMQHAAANASA